MIRAYTYTHTHPHPHTHTHTCGFQVEYLYTLVYETLDRLAKKRGDPRHKSSLKREGDDVDQDLDVSVLPKDPEFLDWDSIQVCVSV